MKFLVGILLMILVLFLDSCKNDRRQVYRDGDSNSGVNPELQKKYQAILPVLISSCLTSGCHAGGKIIDLTSAAKFKASEAKTKKRVSGGTMPPPNSGPGQAFNDTKRTTLLSFFN